MRNKQILVIEDSGEIAYQLKIRLSAQNFDVVVAQTGHAGLEKARELNPDLILLDLMLPELDGYRVCRFLKFDAEYEHIPIIIITARSLAQDRDLALEAGADAYFLKPLDWKPLMETINRLIETSGKIEQQQQPEEEKSGETKPAGEA